LTTMSEDFDLHIRILCLHGKKGHYSTACFKSIPKQTRVAHLKMLIGKEYPSQDIELMHQGSVMRTQSDLIEYGIMTTSVIDAIVTLTRQDKGVAFVDFEPLTSKVQRFERFKVAMSTKTICRQPETVNFSESAKKTKKEKLNYFRCRQKTEETEDQVCHSNSIHIFALIACDNGAVRTDFYLDMGTLGSCPTISHIKDHVRTWADEASADVELMLVSDRSTPLDDDHIVSPLPLKLFAIMSI